MTKMTKEGLVEALMKAADIEVKAQARRIVEALFDTIQTAMVRGEKVDVSGFGSFYVRKQAARDGRNPKTGEKIRIAASVKPKFRAAKALKEAVQ